MTTLRAFRFQLQPSPRQRWHLERMGDARRFAYNWGLERWRAHHAATGRTIKLTALMQELTMLKRQPGMEWLRDVDSQLLQQALFDLRQAYRSFFARRARYPSFKSRKRDPQRFRIPQRVRVDRRRVYVPKVGWVRARISREVVGRLKSATFKRDPAGRWFVSIVAHVDVPERHPLRLTPALRAIGIDLGLRDFAVLSTGERVPHPRFAARANRQLRRAHRALSRANQGSRNRAKARRRLASLYVRNRNRRQDFLHKLTTRLIEHHDLVAVEDLGVNGLARTKLARGIADSGFREFRRQLEYKAQWSGNWLIVVDRFFPSSKTCGNCGATNSELRPAQREWICGCGAVLDRDLNAARNILEFAVGTVAVGRTDTENACRARVRPPTEAVGVEAGIP